MISISPKLKKQSTLKERLSYLRGDKIFFSIFAVILIKNYLLLNVLITPGSSKLNFGGFNFINTLIAVSFIGVFLSFTFLLDRRLHLWSLVVLNFILSIIIIGDLWYYRGFSAFLSPYLLHETSNLHNLSSSVLSMARPIDLIFIGDNLFIVLFAAKLNKKYKSMARSQGIFAYLLGVSLAVILILHLALDVNIKDKSEPQMFHTQWIPYATLRNLSLLGFHTYDTFMYMIDQVPYNMSAAEKEKISKWFAHKNEDLPANQYKGVFAGKNLIVIQVESLENFVINHSYQGQEITPNLNKLLKNSLYFSNYYEQVYNGNSSDADLMTNASVYPVRRGSTFFRFPDNSYNTLPMLLKEKGYTAKAFHSDYGYYWNVKNAMLNFGFDEFRDLDTFEHKDIFWMGLTDECFLSQVKDNLAATKAPFYAFAVTTTSHNPFKMPEKFKNLSFDPEFDKTYMGGYFQSVNYADRQIGKFIDELDQLGLLDNTVIAIYGDHSGVHKYYNDEIAKIEPQESWWKADHKVPLLIYNKGLSGREITTIGGQIDLFPTLAYTMGVDDDKYLNTAIGRNLVNTERSFALLSDGKIIGENSLSDEEKKYIRESFDISDKIIRTNYFIK